MTRTILRVTAGLVVTVGMLLTACAVRRPYRYTHVSLAVTEGVEIDRRGTPDLDHPFSVSAMPLEYSLARSDYKLRFSMAKDYSGGCIISAESWNGDQLRVVSEERPLAHPGYGNCRAYYQEDNSLDLLFFDQCGSGLHREMFISFRILGPSGVIGQERIAYEIDANGWYWAVDSL